MAFIFQNSNNMGNHLNFTISSMLSIGRAYKDHPVDFNLCRTIAEECRMFMLRTLNLYHPHATHQDALALGFTVTPKDDKLIILPATMFTCIIMTGYYEPIKNVCGGSGKEFYWEAPDGSTIRWSSTGVVFTPAIEKVNLHITINPDE